MFRRINWKTLLFIVLIVGLAVATIAFKRVDLGIGDSRFQRGSDRLLGLELGLDLAGGTQLVYQAGTAETPPTDEEMDGLMRIITRRVNSIGVTEPTLERLGKDRFIVRLPGITDVDRAKRLVGQTARLEIIERICLTRACGEGDYQDVSTGLTGRDMARSSPGQDPVTGEALVSFELKSSGARTFGEVTERIFRSNTTDSPDQLTIKLDDVALVSAGVRQPILSGSGQITGGFNAQSARDIAIQIQSGALPVPIHELSTQIVAPSLGQQSLEDSLLAGIIGLALVLFFMAAYYRGSGLVAGVALLCYLAVNLAVYKLIPVTLTLAGVAGFILSLGMAVDANVLIFERMKEELRIGRTLPFAIQIGFSRAWSSIWDGNFTTLLIAGILFLFGQQTANSSVTGFAVTLSIGVLISMFSAITITKSLLVLLSVTAVGRLTGLFTPERLPSRGPGGREAGVLGRGT